MRLFLSFEILYLYKLEMRIKVGLTDNEMSTHLLSHYLFPLPSTGQPGMAESGHQTVCRCFLNVFYSVE